VNRAEVVCNSAAAVAGALFNNYGVRRDSWRRVENYDTADEAEELLRSIRTAADLVELLSVMQKREAMIHGGARNHYIIIASSLDQGGLSAGLCTAMACCSLATAFTACSARHVLRLLLGACADSTARAVGHGESLSFKIKMHTSRDPVCDSSRDLSSCLRARGSPAPPSAQAHSKQKFLVSAYAAQSCSMVPNKGPHTCMLAALHTTTIPAWEQNKDAASIA
jgi:hypothetical protein